jgi:Zn-dependent M28 family amino/carboxypeptidase
MLDSVPTSNGVTDDGMAVVTLLELMRYFVRHPPRQTIIFLINNFEEGGLIGARAFMNHPWYPTVKLFINLGKFRNVSGVYGRALVFIQCWILYRGCWCWWSCSLV